MWNGNKHSLIPSLFKAEKQKERKRRILHNQKQENNQISNNATVFVSSLFFFLAGFLWHNYETNISNIVARRKSLVFNILNEIIKRLFNEMTQYKVQPVASQSMRGICPLFIHATCNALNMSDHQPHDFTFGILIGLEEDKLLFFFFIKDRLFFLMKTNSIQPGHILYRPTHNSLRFDIGCLQKRETK